MRIHISFRFVVAFLLLVLIMLELHELVHISTGRVICGCWGSRDFNVWSLCDGCARSEYGWIATLAGPVYSFAMMWFGAGLLYSGNRARVQFGFLLVFANIPFGRITSAMMGGGDEMMVTKHFFAGPLSHAQMIVVCSGILLIVGVPPILIAAGRLTNKFKWLYVAAFLTAPLAFILLYVLVGLNSLLSAGFLSEVWIMGTPLLITIHTILAAILLWFFRRSIVNTQS